MGAFVRGKQGQYTRSINIGVPSGNGVTFHPMVFTFNEVSQEYFAETCTRIKEVGDDGPSPQKIELYSAVCQDIVAGWQPNGNVYEETDGTPVEFSPENLIEFLTFPLIADTIVAGWLNAHTARQDSGNSKGRRSGG